MFRRDKPAFALTAALSLLLLPQLTRAQNLVQNGGFETGDLTGWTITKGSPTVGALNGKGAPHSGTYKAEMTPGGFLSGISQTLLTTPNQTYTLSFRAAADSSNNTFAVLWNSAFISGSPITIPANSDNNQSASDYLNYTFDVTANSAGSSLEFDASNPPAWTVLDDISVTPKIAATPAPGSLLTLLLGAVPGAVLLLRRKR